MKKMKFVALLLVAVLLCVPLVACSGGTAAPAESASSEAPAEAPAESASSEASVNSEKVEEAEKGLAEGVSDDVKGKKIAFINCGPDDYYARYGEVLKSVGDLYGWEVTELNSQNSTETELANVQDMVAKGVDAIVIIAVNFDAAAESCLEANKAGIPIFFFGTSGNFDESTGAKPEGAITFNSQHMGYLVGQYIVDNYPDVKNVAYVEGVIGSGSNEDQIEGFRKPLEDAGINVFSAGTGNYMKDDAIPVVEDLILSGREFDAIYSINDEMGAAIVQVFEENDITDKVIVSSNGKEMALEWLENGKINADSANPPTLAADLMIQTLAKYFAGEDYQEVVRVFMPAVLTKDNTDTAIPWDYQEYMEGRANGDFEYSVDYYAELMNKMEGEMEWLAGA